MIKIKRFIGKDRIKVFGVKFYIRHEYCQRVAANYARKLQVLRERYGKGVIRVGFITRENSKWSYESLYRQLEEHPHFEPVVLIVDDNFKPGAAEETEKNLSFFREYRHVVIRNKRDYVRQRTDVLFYEQPWYDLAGDLTPEQLSAHSLNFYVPYCIETDIEPAIIAETAPFHKALYSNFCFSEDMARQLAAHGVENTHVVGHPRLDAYLTPGVSDDPWQSTDKVRIIYAPHHAFGDSVLKQASWDWSGERVLQLARQHQDTTEWILKPHPRFWQALGEWLKSDEKARQIREAWAEVAPTYDKGNYFDLFKTADLMISDCVSFNIEWLPTRKPFLRLRSHYPDATVFPGIEHYAEHYYYAGNVAELDECFDMLVHRSEDPAREARMERAKEIPMGVGARIIDILTSALTQ